jgi:hypothetical protein
MALGMIALHRKIPDRIVEDRFGAARDHQAGSPDGSRCNCASIRSA